MGWLRGRTVVVTRAADRHDDLAALLEARGAEVIALPLVAVARRDDEAARLPGLIGETEWVAVTSVNGALAINDAVGGHPWPATVRTAAVGPSTATALGTCDLVPEVHSARGLAAALGDGHGQRILVVEAAGATRTLTSSLAQQGWIVTAVHPYETVAVAVEATALAGALAADAMVFTSGSAARAWMAAAAEHGIEPIGPLIVAMGPQTAGAIADDGLKVDLVAADHSLDGIVTVMDTLPHPLR